MEQSAVSSNEAIKWANQTKCQTSATIIAFLSHVICLRAYILFAMIDKIKMRWTLTIRQYTTYVMGNDWCPLTAGDGDLVIAPLPSFVCWLSSACLLPSPWLPWHCLVPSWSTNILPLSSRSHCCLQHDIGRILIDCAFDVFCAYWFYFMIIKQF